MILLTFIKTLSSKVWMYLVIGIGVLGFLFKVRQSGEDRVVRDGLEKTLDAVNERKRIENEIHMSSDDDVTLQLRKLKGLRD